MVRGGSDRKFGLFYLFSDFGDIPQRQLFQEVLEFLYGPFPPISTGQIMAYTK